MNMPNKFIETLSDDDHSKLVESYQSSSSFRVRTRAHAVLLSYEKYPIDEIAAICRAHRNTVSRWLAGWSEDALDGLSDAPKEGRPPILTAAEEEKAVSLAMANPKFPHRQLSEIERKTGKRISKYTLKRLIKKRIISGNASS